VPRRIHHSGQHRSMGASAGDLGLEAYEANTHDSGRPPESPTIVPAWQSPEPSNAPPEQHRSNAHEPQIGTDRMLKRFE
jgi:hypothetical protein